MGTRWAQRPGNNPEARRSGTWGSGCRQSAAWGRRRGEATLEGMVTGCWGGSPRWACVTDLPLLKTPWTALQERARFWLRGVVPGRGRRREPPCGWRRPGLGAPRAGSVAESQTIPSPFPAEEEAVDAAREDVGPNAHGQDRRGSVQRDGLRCGQSGLQSHHARSDGPQEKAPGL